MQQRKHIISSTISLKLPSKKLLLSQTETYQPTNSISENIYGAFAFKDRITNNAFSYCQALNDRNINDSTLQNLEAKKADQKLKHLLKTYKFTKQFEIKCIRDRYKPTSKGRMETQTTTNDSRLKPNIERAPAGKRQMSRQQIFQRSKEQFRKMLACGKRPEDQSLRLNEARLIPHRRVGKKVSKRWFHKEQQKYSTCSNQDAKIYDQALNHMNCQLKIDNQFLLNLPQKVKRKALLKEQLQKSKNRQHLNKQISRLKSNQQIKQKIQQLSFFPIRYQEMSSPVTSMEENGPKQASFLELVHSGFVNEAYLQILTNPLLIYSIDEKGNNAFHIAAKQGNSRMIREFFKGLPSKLIAEMLSSRNKMGRTPLQRARMLGQCQSIQCIQNWTKCNYF